jgi:hypothetical protein
MGKPHGASGVKWGLPCTELGWAMREDQARAALMIVEALERVGWRIMKAAALLGYRDYGQLDDYVTQLGLRRLVQRKRREASVQNMVSNYRSTATIVMLHAAGDDEAARAMLYAAIRAEKGNVQRMARRLGIVDSCVRKYVRVLGLSNDLFQLRMSAQGHWRSRARHRAWVESRRKS